MNHRGEIGSGEGLRILIKGAGEQASATAHRLYKCGFFVVMTELERPTAVRRSVSFSSALYDGRISVEGVTAIGYRLQQADVLSRLSGDHIPVFVDPDCRLRGIWQPEIIIDARILKKNLDNSLDDAALVIGLGPGLEAGRDVHVVIETHRGHDLGRIITRGCAASDTGQPGEVGGYTHERVLIAPAAGIFESARQIGEIVQAGEEVGRVGGVAVRAGISGVIRGLLYPGLEVTPRQKLGDVDPRGDPAYCTTLSDKARTISGSVLEVVVRHAGHRSE